MSYTRHSAYRQASATSWTRIDMLLALYDAAVFAAEHGLNAIRSDDEMSLIKHRIRAQQLITQLLSGVDTEQGELPRNVHRLLTYCLLQTCGNSIEEWSSVASTLGQLKGAFREIRERAIELERAGRIPRLELGLPEQTLAVG